MSDRDPPSPLAFGTLVPPGAAFEPPADLAEVAARIARAIAEAERTKTEARPRAIVFRVGDARLGLPLQSVREVLLPPIVLSTVPRAPAAVLGIMNLRGRVVAVVDLLHALPPEESALALPPERPPTPPGNDLADGRILLLERGRREVGLLVASVEGIADLSGEAGLHVLDPARVEATLEALVT